MDCAFLWKKTVKDEGHQYIEEFQEHQRMSWFRSGVRQPFWVPAQQKGADQKEMKEEVARQTPMVR
jgi:hypothetical protein